MSVNGSMNQCQGKRYLADSFTTAKGVTHPRDTFKKNQSIKNCQFMCHLSRKQSLPYFNWYSTIIYYYKKNIVAVEETMKNTCNSSASASSGAILIPPFPRPSLWDKTVGIRSHRKQPINIFKTENIHKQERMKKQNMGYLSCRLWYLPWLRWCNIDVSCPATTKHMSHLQWEVTIQMKITLKKRFLLSAPSLLLTYLAWRFRGGGGGNISMD